jgi:glutamate-1-semialdehyde 2,1-aminomutase
MISTEDSLWVAEELTRQWGFPKWRSTLSASQANTEAIRLARAVTGRDRVLFFGGKYLGHFDDALVELRDGHLVPEEHGLPRSAIDRARVVQFHMPSRRDKVEIFITCRNLLNHGTIVRDDKLWI